MMAFTASLRWRLGLSMAVGVLALAVLALTGIYLILRDFTLEESARAQLEQQQLVANNLDEILAGVERRTAELSAQILNAKPNPEQLLEMLKARVLNDSETASLGVMLEPHNPVRSNDRFAAVATYGSAGLQITDFVASGYGSWSGYQYWTKDWYLRTLQRTSGWWSDPYFNDAAGGQDTITWDYPLLDRHGQAYGMIGVSIPLDRLTEIAAASGIRSRRDVRQVMADARGKILVAWDPSIERAYDLAQAAERKNSPALTWLAEADRLSGSQVISLLDSNGGRERLAYTIIPRVQWRLGSIISDQQLLAPLHITMQRLVMVIMPALLLLMPLLFLIANRLTKPLDHLTRNTERIAQGDFSIAVLATAPADEFKRLASAVEHVRTFLQEQTQRTQSSDAKQADHALQRERASRTQRALLPANRLFFGPHLQCEIAGNVISETGLSSIGYGFVAPVPGSCAFFLIALAGHTLSNALNLAHLMAVLPALLGASDSPSDWLRKASEHWLNEGDPRADVRLLVGRIDLDTGQLSLASADHPAPMIMLSASTGASVVELTSGPMIGAGGSPNWPMWHGAFSERDRLVVPSCALIEDHSNGASAFGLERILASMARNSGQSASAQAHALLDEAHALTTNTITAEDLAVLVLSIQERE